jgi:hypothetical protein
MIGREVRYEHNKDKQIKTLVLLQVSYQTTRRELSDGICQKGVIMEYEFSELHIRVSRLGRLR